MVSNKAEEELILSWAKDPKSFILGPPLRFEKLSSQQLDAIEQVRLLVACKIRKYEGHTLTKAEEEYARKIGISIMSGRGTGKDVLCAALMFWFLTCFPSPLVAATAPTAHQLKDVLWRELTKIMNGTYSLDRQPGLVRDWFVLQSDKLYWKEAGGKSWFAIARTANPKSSPEEQAETLSGLHEPYMMIVADEASGLSPAIFNPLEGTLTQKVNFIFMIFNPTQSHGYAIDSQMKNRDQWLCLRWNAEDSEHVSRESIEMKARRGKDTNFYRVNVLGLPPKSESDTLIPWEWVMDAIDRDVLPTERDPVIFGADVGAGGDVSVYLKRHGPKVFPLDINDSSDSNALTDWFINKILKSNPSFGAVDSIGVGWAIAGNLQRLVQNCEIRALNVSELPSEADKFVRMRDELWWRLREKFELRIISIPNDDELIAELTTIKYIEDSRGRVKVESKKELTHRNLPSPNRADALVMTELYETDTIREIGGKRKSANWRRDYAGSWKTI